MLIYAGIPLQFAHCILWFAPYFWLAIQLQNRAKWLFLAPVVLEFPVYIARTVLPYFIIDESLLPFLQYAMLMDVVYNSIRFLMLVCLSKLLRSSLKVFDGIFDLNLKSAELLKKSESLGHIYLIFGIACLLNLAITSEQGLVGWLNDPRNGYQNNRFGLGHWWVLSQFFLGVSLYLYTFHSASRFRVLSFSAMVGAVTFFLGSKILLLNITVYVLGLWQYRFGKSLMAVAIFLAISIASMLSLFFMGFSGEYNDAVIQITNYFDYYINGALYYQSTLTGKLPLYHGSVFLGNLWSLMPRLIFPEKPIVYGDLQIVDYFYPGAPELGHTPAFLGRVTEYADFGFFGLLVSSFFDVSFIVWGISSLYAITLLKDEKRSPGRGFFMLLLIFSPNLWQYVKGFNVIFMMVAIVVSLKFVSKLRIYPSMRSYDG